MPLQEKKLTIYPIANGNELSIFASEAIKLVRVMDMQGNLQQEASLDNKTQCTLDIAALPSDTYLAEVTFNNNDSTRSVFVKL